jgi:hypothetical protein
MKVKLLEPIQGYEDEAEIRCVKSGEYFVDYTTGVANVNQWSISSISTGRALVLTKKKQWRPATVEDGVRAIRGEKVVARFRHWTTVPWKEGELATVWPEAYETRWGMRNSCSYLFCEVLDV